ncbi:HAD family hydrolase [Adhaeribacter aquaticus]|uniref:HAD family hydrolase n=1 Tax=Adhaeribacter aquaticus TaxID=299567 RepID=UPI00040775B7|nr:HAD family phosphatase [Adhaeribacter aquaticus]
MSTKPKAFLFDLNGTMIDDMHYHGKAWHHMLNNELGASLSQEEVKVQMYGKNSEVLDRIFGKGRFTAEEADKISIEKERRYQEEYFPYLSLINGLDTFLVKAEENNVAMAIGSAAIPFNIDFVLDNLHIRHYFKTIVSADDVTESKPHPETFLKAAQQLGIAPADCVVFEDAPKGVEAAQNAGMPCVVLTTMHEKEEFSQYQNIIHFVQDYTDPVLRQLFSVSV